MIDAMKLAEALMVMAYMEDEMNTNNFEAQRNTMVYGKPVTRKTVNVSGRVFRQEQLERGK